MSSSNFTPIKDKLSSKKKSSSKLKIFSLISIFVMIVGVGVGYVMVSKGFIFRPKAESRGGNLGRYGWNGSCFTNFSPPGFDGIDHAARYQCPGKIGQYGGGCQKSNGSRTGVWDYNKIPLRDANGVSQVCLDPSGNSGPKDANGCFTQQLDLDDGVAYELIPGTKTIKRDKFGNPTPIPGHESPEAWYSYDDCKPTDPKPPASPTPTTPPSVTPTPSSTPTPTAGPSPTPTLTPTPGPSATPTLTPTPRPSATPTPTPPFCVEPGTPANVHINCPLCNQSNSQ